MTSALEEIKILDIEEWLTLATAPSPTKLKQGQSPNMENVWTDEKPGSVITAPGFVKVGTTPSNNPSPFCINYFKTSSGTQTFVISDNSTVWTTIDFQNFTPIITGLASAFQLRGLVVRDKLWLTNGSDAVRTFDGTTVVVLDGTAGTPAVPRSRYIAYHDERVWLYHVSSNRSAVYFSSLTDSAANIIDPDNVNAWDIVDNFLQISEGDADFGTGMLLYRGYLHFFKQYSIWRLVGYDEYTYSRVKTRSSTGCRFNESIQILDSLVHLIGIDGIYVFDGEESERISDIIDPATASQTAFGFNQLQQPNQNSQFWEVTATADWNAGTVPTNLAINDAATLEAADDSQADFAAGITQTFITTSDNPGFLQLAHGTAGVSSQNVAAGLGGSINPPPGGAAIGSSPQLTDGDLVTICGYTGSGGPNVSLAGSLTVNCISGINLTTVILRQVRGGPQGVTFFADGVKINAFSVTGPNTITSGTLNLNAGSLSDVTITFSVFTCSVLSIKTDSSWYMQLAEVQVFSAKYNSVGQFISKALDLGITPASLGNFNASEVLNGEGTSYFTQSSADGVVWDGQVAVSNGGAIGSTPRRFLRWGVNFTSDGLNTPQIDAVYLPTLYLSAIHNTGGSIFSWGPFESDYSLLGQVINFYYRTATTSAGIAGATWNLIVPGGAISDPVANQYVQFRFEILSGTASNLPVVNSVTINWVAGSGTQSQTLQNVASTYWRNRYWLSAAGPSATSNDTILIRGKKTFQSPWMLKDWNILSFTRYQDSLYGGSSLDGSIYQLDSGYSKAGAAMSSYFETGDFTFGGFTANFIEAILEVERLGSWNLTFGYSVDGGNTWKDSLIPLTLSSYDTNFSKRMNINVTTTRIRFHFLTSGADTPFQVHRFIGFYKLEVERGSIIGDYMAAPA